MGYWQIKYGGVTKDASAWGVENIKRTRESARTDTVTFSLPGWIFATTPPFAYKQQVTIYANGVQWFVGWVSKLPRKGNARREQQDYEISGPWWWLEKTLFQQMWTYNAVGGGGGVAQVTTAQSSVIMGQALNGLKLNSGQVILEALLYAQYAFQGQPYPTTTLNALPSGAPPSFWPPQIPTTLLLNLPSPPNPANGALPFQIGVVTPSIATVFSEVRDKKCADIIRLAMRYTPDAVAWTDHTTSPPTINIDRRGNLDGKAISVLGGTVVGEFDPEPRYDLVPSAVLVKYQTTQTTNGNQLSFLLVDQYPEGVADNDPDNIVFTLDLVGSSTTTQTAQVVTTPRPVSAADSITMNWIFKHDQFFKQNPMGNVGTYVYDWPNISCAFLATRLDDNDPLRTSNPNGVTIVSAVGAPVGAAPGDCVQLVNELLSAFPGWLQEAEELDSADVVVEYWLQYTGTQAATFPFFWYDPSNPGLAKKDGTGYYVGYIALKATNADTESYTRLTSYQGGEPEPVGVAQYMYEALAALHWSGTIKFTEPECSDILPIGCIFNTSDGDAAWATMNALVLRVVEDIDTGTTDVTFGPPLTLGFDDLIEIIRANEGVRPSMQLNQRTSGQTASGAQVTETKHAGGKSATRMPSPGGSASTPQPWDLIFRNVGTATSPAWEFQVNTQSVLQNTDNSQISITGVDSSWISIDSSKTEVWLEGTVASGNTTAVSVVGGNSGTFSPYGEYWTPSGPAVNDGVSPPNQTLWRKLIATIAWSTGSAPAPTATNVVAANLKMFDTTLGYLPAVYPY